MVFEAPGHWKCVSKPEGGSDWHTQVNYDSQIPCVQMDFQFISGVADWCPEAQATATVLTMVDVDSGCVGDMRYLDRALAIPL